MSSVRLGTIATFLMLLASMVALRPVNKGSLGDYAMPVPAGSYEGVGYVVQTCGPNCSLLKDGDRYYPLVGKDLTRGPIKVQVTSDGRQLNVRSVNEESGRKE